MSALVAAPAGGAPHGGAASKAMAAGSSGGGADARRPADQADHALAHRHHQQAALAPALDEHSPFEHAAAAPLEPAAAGAPARAPKAPLLARLFPCLAPPPAVLPAEESSSAEQHVLVVAGSAGPAGGVKQPSGGLGSAQHSWAAVRAHTQAATQQQQQQQQHLQPATSRTSTEWHDARSQGSLDLTPAGQHADGDRPPPPPPASPQPKQPLQPLQQDQQPPQQDQQQPGSAPWVPNPPLLFTDEALKFVPVPPVTGFAGVWEIIEERTSPHPQPIDVMIGASFVVRKIHKSLPGVTMEEDEGQFLVHGQPSFIPPGLPAAYHEHYDKTNATTPSWMPRRDVRLGSAYGEIFYTSDGRLILRQEARPPFSSKAEYIVEDYLTLEEGGNVIVDRMCCLCVKTGQRAEQLQVVRRKA